MVLGEQLFELARVNCSIDLYRHQIGSNGFADASEYFYRALHGDGAQGPI
jgi:hypothetical protein